MGAIMARGVSGRRGSARLECTALPGPKMFRLDSGSLETPEKSEVRVKSVPDLSGHSQHRCAHSNTSGTKCRQSATTREGSTASPRVYPRRTRVIPNCLSGNFRRFSADHARVALRCHPVVPRVCRVGDRRRRSGFAALSLFSRRFPQVLPRPAGGLGAGWRVRRQALFNLGAGVDPPADELGADPRLPLPRCCAWAGRSGGRSWCTARSPGGWRWPTSSGRRACRRCTCPPTGRVSRPEHAASGAVAGAGAARGAAGVRRGVWCGAGREPERRPAAERRDRAAKRWKAALASMTRWPAASRESARRIAASAGTVMVGLGLMALAEFAKVRYAGPAIAIQSRHRAARPR